MPESTDAQCANLFAHVRELMELPGAHTDDIEIPRSATSKSPRSRTRSTTRSSSPCLTTGDVVRGEVEGLGVIENRLVAAPGA